jgi:hypothetical protein
MQQDFKGQKFMGIGEILLTIYYTKAGITNNVNPSFSKTIELG